MCATEQANRDAALAFYDTRLNTKDFKKAVSYLGDDYKQHNPMVGNGVEGLLVRSKAEFPNMSCEIQRVLVDGDYVILHNFARSDPEERGTVLIDIFRCEDGKVVEHWDALQDIPETTLNGPKMY